MFPVNIAPIYNYLRAIKIMECIKNKLAMSSYVLQNFNTTVLQI